MRYSTIRISERMLTRFPGKFRINFELIEILRDNAFDPHLHTKPLGPPLRGIFSFRITRDYRVGFEFNAPRVVRLLAVDKRDQIYKRLERKMR